MVSLTCHEQIYKIRSIVKLFYIKYTSITPQNGHIDLTHAYYVYMM